MNTRDKLREAFIRWFQDFGMDNLTNVSIVNQDFFFFVSWPFRWTHKSFSQNCQLYKMDRCFIHHLFSNYLLVE